MLNLALAITFWKDISTTVLPNRSTESSLHHFSPNPVLTRVQNKSPRCSSEGAPFSTNSMFAIKTDHNCMYFYSLRAVHPQFGAFAVRFRKTHQKCKDSISVLNPLESPAAFLCLKHNVKQANAGGWKRQICSPKSGGSRSQISYI